MSRKVVIISMMALVTVMVSYYFINGYFTSVLINDVTIRHSDSARYKILYIDGHVPNRIQSLVITMVPFVYTSPGLHEVQVEVISDTGSEIIQNRQEVKMYFDSYSRYDLQVVEGNAVFIKR